MTELSKQAKAFAKEAEALKPMTSKNAVKVALESIGYSKQHIRNFNYDLDASTDLKLRKQAMDKLESAEERLRMLRDVL